MPAKTLAQKLMLKPGRRLMVIHPPVDFLEKLQPLPDFAAVTVNAAEADAIQLFVNSFADLKDQLVSVTDLVKDSTVFWICYPKLTGGIKTDLDRDLLYNYAYDHHFQGINMIAIDKTWSAMRFKLR